MRQKLSVYNGTWENDMKSGAGVEWTTKKQRPVY